MTNEEYQSKLREILKSTGQALKLTSQILQLNDDAIMSIGRYEGIGELMGSGDVITDSQNIIDFMREDGFLMEDEGMESKGLEPSPDLINYPCPNCKMMRSKAPHTCMELSDD